MDTNIKGNLGEAKALHYFISNGYEVFTSFGTASSCDMIVLKDGITQRVSVKTTTSITPSGKYRVDLRQKGHKNHKDFDSTTSDLLFFYVIPEDRVVLLETKSLDRATYITI